MGGDEFLPVRGDVVEVTSRRPPVAESCPRRGFGSGVRSPILGILCESSAVAIYRFGGPGASGAGSVPGVFGALGVFGAGAGVASGVFLPGLRLFLSGAFGSVGAGVLLFGPAGPEVPGSGVPG